MDFQILSFVNEHYACMDQSSKSAARQILNRDLTESKDMLSRLNPGDPLDSEYVNMFADDVEAIEKALELIK